jgi:hypothetical protein
MKNLLEKAEVEVQAEIKRIGFIDDSDNTDRFLDNLSQELAIEEILKGNEDIEFYYEKECEIEELQEKLLEEIKDKIMSKYNHFSTCESGHYKGCYYEIDKEFNNWDEFNDYFERGE